MHNLGHFLPGVPASHVVGRLEKAPGRELTSGKFWSPVSSAALAVNSIGWFVDRPQKLPPLPNHRLGSWSPELVEIEYCARFPWSGGRHPWLDALVMTPTDLVGVESKRFEPFRDKKTVTFSNTYSRHDWGAGMTPYERLRDRLCSGDEYFRFLDAAQLVKHAFGLVTEARRLSKRPHLFYLFAEPARVGNAEISESAKALHRDEIGRFGSLVRDASVSFASASYQEWLSDWSNSDPEIAAHRDLILTTFQP